MQVWVKSGQAGEVSGAMEGELRRLEEQAEGVERLGCHDRRRQGSETGLGPDQVRHFMPGQKESQLMIISEMGNYQQVLSEKSFDLCRYILLKHRFGCLNGT